MVQTYAGKTFVRPDTSLNKENGDFYAPEDVCAIGYCPVIYARISKAGKMVGKEFVQRYYDSIAFGIFLYPSTETRDGKVHYCKACSSCFDHSTILPYPLYNSITLSDEENRFIICKDGKEIFSCNTESVKERLEQAIVSTSAHTSVRIGDFVALELAPIQDLLLPGEEKCSITAKYCENETIDMNLNF